jgi:hypothetical protein
MNPTGMGRLEATGLRKVACLGITRAGWLYHLLIQKPCYNVAKLNLRWKECHGYK